MDEVMVSCKFQELTKSHFSLFVVKKMLSYLTIENISKIYSELIKFMPKIKHQKTYDRWKSFLVEVKKDYLKSEKNDVKGKLGSNNTTSFVNPNTKFDSSSNNVDLKRLGSPEITQDKLAYYLSPTSKEIKKKHKRALEDYTDKGRKQRNSQQGKNISLQELQEMKEKYSIPNPQRNSVQRVRSKSDNSHSSKNNDSNIDSKNKDNNYIHTNSINNSYNTTNTLFSNPNNQVYCNHIQPIITINNSSFYGKPEQDLSQNIDSNPSLNYHHFNNNINLTNLPNNTVLCNNNINNNFNSYPLYYNNVKNNINNPYIAQKSPNNIMSNRNSSNQNLNNSNNFISNYSNLGSPVNQQNVVYNSNNNFRIPQQELHNFSSPINLPNNSQYYNSQQFNMNNKNNILSMNSSLNTNMMNYPYNMINNPNMNMINYNNSTITKPQNNINNMQNVSSNISGNNNLGITPNNSNMNQNMKNIINNNNLPINSGIFNNTNNNINNNINIYSNNMSSPPNINFPNFTHPFYGNSNVSGNLSNSNLRGNVSKNSGNLTNLNNIYHQSNIENFNQSHISNNKDKN